MKNVKSIFFGEYGNYLFLLATTLFCLSGCKSEMPDRCDENWMSHIYVKESGTETPIEGASIYMVLTGHMYSYAYVHDETTDVNGYAEWPCALEYDNLSICAGDAYWEECGGSGWGHGHPDIKRNVFYLTAKCMIRVHIPEVYHSSTEEYGYVSVIISSGGIEPDGYNGSTEYGHYQDMIGKGAYENQILVTHFNVSHEFTGQQERYCLYVAPHDTIDFYIPEP
jgi:hypothetical protein